MTHPTPSLHLLWKKQHRLKISLFFVVLVVAILLLWLSPHYFVTTQPNQASSEDNTAVSGKLTKGTPDYPTILPSGKTITQLGGWTRVSPPDHNAVYAYTDTIDGTPIIVSQQPLPDILKDNVATQMEEFAKGYSADRFITVGSVKVYIGTSTKGPQSIIFTRNRILILIKTSAIVKDSSLTHYIQSLK